ncbi:uncharacterized protein LOC121865724 [Homarus americanus]|uniref:Putative ML domain-containing protein 1 n=1 Tax=Homarus americanus TaxID=6706 RepID=A0A8J5KD01_HOMAM|nr:uncharacterized protein LOC121865724 [Homarus americanus]XP_042221197.1 uncharacterized protein LOC121865724 [Homarus americanus]KAG7169498.1 putative ML domain-containing protein 1 [Homarus americanus]
MRMWCCRMTRVLMLVTSFYLAQGIRVDDKEGFTLCNVPQLAQLNSVEVRECTKWPCLARAGRSGTYQITLTQQTNEDLYNIKSDIYAWVRLPFINANNKPVRVSMPGEKKKPLCRFTDTGCPLAPGVPTTIRKSITIPIQARMAQGNVVVEFRVTDDNERVLTCFRAPVIVA